MSDSIKAKPSAWAVKAAKAFQGSTDKADAAGWIIAIHYAIDRCFVQPTADAVLPKGWLGAYAEATESAAVLVNKSFLSKAWKAVLAYAPQVGAHFAREDVAALAAVLQSEHGAMLTAYKRVLNDENGDRPNGVKSPEELLLVAARRAAAAGWSLDGFVTAAGEAFFAADGGDSAD